MQLGATWMMDAMQASGRDEVAAGLARLLARLWRYGLVVSGNRDVAQDLVQATCVRALDGPISFLPARG